MKNKPTESQIKDTHTHNHTPLTRLRSEVPLNHANLPPCDPLSAPT